MNGETRQSLRNSALTLSFAVALCIGFALTARCEVASPAYFESPPTWEEFDAARRGTARIICFDHASYDALLDLRASDKQAASELAAARVVISAHEDAAKATADVIAARDARIAELEAEVQRLNGVIENSDRALVRCQDKLTRGRIAKWASIGFGAGMVLDEALR